MSPNLAVIVDGKKFMWDGQLYENRDEATRTEQSYQDEGFETQVVEESGKFLLYSRRTAKEVAVAAQ
jgi:hypothetical protein